MSDIKAKMHQIRFRLGLCPTRRWGSLQRSPDPVAGGEGLAAPSSSTLPPLTALRASNLYTEFV